MPGLGDVDWRGFFSGLYRAGYDGPYFLTFGPRPALLAGRDHVIARAASAATSA